MTLLRPGQTAFQGAVKGLAAGTSFPTEPGESQRRGVMGRRLPPTQHRQSEQQVLAQLAAQPQSQVPVLGRLLRAEVAVGHPHFDLLRHVVGTTTEMKAVVRDHWAPPSHQRGTARRRSNASPRHTWESGNMGKKIKTKEATQGTLNSSSRISRTLGPTQ